MEKENKEYCSVVFDLACQVEVINGISFNGEQKLQLNKLLTLKNEFIEQLRQKLEKTKKKMGKLTDKTLWSDKILSKVLQGLKRICNHCTDKDCANYWSNEICEEIKQYFDKKKDKSKIYKEKK